LAAEYFHADLALAAVRAEHQAFYRRAFNYQLLCEPRQYPLLAKPVSLMAIRYPTASEVVYRRLPFLRSTYAERRMLFERNPLAGRQDEVPRQDKLVPFVEFDSKRAPG
jgi:hypothetical protein